MFTTRSEHNCAPSHSVLHLRELWGIVVTHVQIPPTSPFQVPALPQQECWFLHAHLMWWHIMAHITYTDRTSTMVSDGRQEMFAVPLHIKDTRPGLLKLASNSANTRQNLLTSLCLCFSHYPLPAVSLGQEPLRAGTVFHDMTVVYNIWNSGSWESAEGFRHCCNKYTNNLLQLFVVNGHLLGLQK